MHSMENNLAVPKNSDSLSCCSEFPSVTIFSHAQERDGHRVAFNKAFVEMGMKVEGKDMHWDGVFLSAFPCSALCHVHVKARR